MARALSAGLLLASFFVSGLARSDQLPLRIVLSASVCPGNALDAAVLENELRSELEAEGIAVLAPGTSDGARLDVLEVSISCAEPLRARVQITRPASARSAEQGVALDDATPNTRPRALALAAVEILRTEWPTLNRSVTESELPSATPDTASPTPAPPAPVPEKKAVPAKPEATPVAAAARPPSADEMRAPAHSTPESRRRHATAAAQTRWLLLQNTALFGGALGGDFDALRARAVLLFGSRASALGTATFGEASLSLGYRVLRAHAGGMSFSVYPCAALGATWLGGSSTSALVRISPTASWYGDVHVELSAELAPSAFSPTISAEIGQASGLIARSGNTPIAATGGLFVGAVAGGRY